MGIRYEDRCSNCAVPGYPCNGMHKRIPVPFCDECGEEDETIYRYDGEELCLQCIKERLEEVK